MTSQEIIALCICTRGRPKMLAQCVKALAGLRPVKAWDLSILVIDNNETPMPAEKVQEIRALSPHPLHVFHEPEPGIPFARNRALDEALALGADWIGFLDDDEEADADWLVEMHRASLAYEADILHGWTQSRPPADANPLFPPSPPRNKREKGAEMNTAGTDNVLFRARILLGKDGVPLRFDENMRFIGGGDRDFFLRARDNGHKIVWVPDAIARETIPLSRLTFFYQVARARSVASNQTYIGIKRGGLATTLRKEGVKALGRTIAGVAGLALSPFHLVKGMPGFRKAVLKASKKLAYGYGVLGYFLKLRPERYRRIDGD